LLLRSNQNKEQSKDSIKSQNNESKKRPFKSKGETLQIKRRDLTNQKERPFKSKGETFQIRTTKEQQTKKAEATITDKQRVGTTPIDNIRNGSETRANRLGRTRFTNANTDD
jgi:hypothetical protein